jgi:flavin-dependent thymidylate synthase
MISVFIKRLIEKVKLKKEEKNAKFKGPIYNTIVYTNNFVDIVFNACKICYNKSTEATYEEKLEYIRKRIETGHESILEHSNVVSYYIFSTEYLDELSELLTHCLYLKTKMKIKGNNVYLIIGGSIRGYKHIFRNIENQDNRIAKAVLDNMYFVNAEFFKDFIDDGIMDATRFNSSVRIEYPRTEDLSVEDTQFTNIDDVYFIYEALDRQFTYDQLLEFGTITVLFKDLSRIISQQLTRHRNGITQLSQRYVDYGKGDFIFNSPDMFKPEKYDKDQLYTISYTSPKGEKIINQSYTLQQLGQALMSIYPQLTAQGLTKEDARAYLLNNVTTDLYITFTFKSLISFLYVREEKGAQAEIRQRADNMGKIFRRIVGSTYGTDIFKYLTPAYKKALTEESFDAYDSIDEVVGEKEEILEV